MALLVLPARGQPIEAMDRLHGVPNLSIKAFDAHTFLQHPLQQRLRDVVVLACDPLERSLGLLGPETV